MDKVTLTLFKVLAENYHRDSVKGFIAMVLCDVDRTIPVGDDKLAFWQAWEDAKRDAFAALPPYYKINRG